MANNDDRLMQIAQKLAEEQENLSASQDSSSDLSKLALNLAMQQGALPQQMMPQDTNQFQLGGLLGQLRNLGLAGTAGQVGLDVLKTPFKAAKTAAQLGIGGGQELQRLGLEVPGVRTGLASLLSHITGRQIPRGAIQPTPVISTETGVGKAGKLLGDIVGAELGGGLGGAIAKTATVPEMIGGVLGSGGVGSLTLPQHPLLGALTFGGGKALTEGAGQLIRKFPNLFLGPLAKNVTDTAETQENLGTNLYKNTFRGTENVMPTVSQKTSQSIRNLQELFPGKQSSVNKAIDSYMRNPNLEGLHGLRSDFSKIYRKIGDKSIKSGLDSAQIDQQSALHEAIGNLIDDTKSNLAKISPQKVAQYEVAQNHWRNNVIPFRNLNSIRKLLGTEKEISPALFKDISKESVSAARIRDLVGVPKNVAQMGEFLHRKYWGLPIGLLIASGIAGKHLL